MKNLKTYENYVDDKIAALKKVAKIIDFMEKYKHRVTNLMMLVLNNTL